MATGDAAGSDIKVYVHVVGSGSCIITRTGFGQRSPAASTLSHGLQCRVATLDGWVMDGAVMVGKWRLDCVAAI